jgi:hypothetical protein
MPENFQTRMNSESSPPRDSGAGFFVGRGEGDDAFPRRVGSRAISPAPGGAPGGAGAMPAPPPYIR